MNFFFIFLILVLLSVFFNSRGKSKRIWLRNLFYGIQIPIMYELAMYSATALIFSYMMPFAFLDYIGNPVTLSDSQWFWLGNGIMVSIIGIFMLFFTYMHWIFKKMKEGE